MSLAPLFIPTCVTTMDSGDGQAFIRVSGGASRLIGNLLRCGGALC